MWLPLVALVAGMVIGWATGGRWANLAVARPRSVGLLVGGVACEAAGAHWSLGGEANAVQVAGYALLVGFAARNYLLVGMGLVGAGLVANLTVIALNGSMPVQPRAVLDAGITTPAGLATLSYGPRHHAARAGDRLQVLADAIPLRPLRLVVSVGDVLLFVGMADVTARLARSAPQHRARPGARRRAHGARPSAPVGRTDERCLEIPVEAVEHRPGGGLLGDAATRQAPTDLTAQRIAQHYEGAVAELGAQGVHRHRLERYRQPELAERAEHSVYH